MQSASWGEWASLNGSNVDFHVKLNRDSVELTTRHPEYDPVPTRQCPDEIRDAILALVDDAKRAVGYEGTVTQAQEFITRFQAFVSDNTQLAHAVEVGIYGASALGYGNFLDRLVARSVLVRPSPQESLRALLREMMEHGVPLLVGTGNKNGGKVSDRAAAEAVTTENFNSFTVKHFGVGSLFVVMDSAMNVICVVRPMAVPWLAPQGTTGYLPEEFRNPLYPSTSSVQFFCEIQCVAAWPQMACATWKLDPRFNFGVDKRDPLAGYKDMRRQGTHLIVNRRCFTTRLFQDYPLAALGDVLGDFVGKLRNFQGAPNKQTLKGDPNHVDKDYCMWRRALLLKMLFESNEGTVSRCLSQHLPVSIVGEPARVSERCANAFKATDFTIAFTRVKVSAMLAHLGFDLQ
ncbi:hypothetical protein D9Q98_004103 [Chlorella vulgaris]|uniref:Uncharacterized protein n=1 Tax=Chlorella vulgaris TaxID=3077 RepID=A0A9D4TRB6_CHLVU|nr:hypothetical protein D9Q98_004103 [Chlorella vulgaris]